MSRYGILVLGAGVMQLPALEAARRNGWYLVVADGNPEALGRELSDAFHVVDLKDMGGLLALARSYYEAGRLHGVFTAGTDFSASVAYVAETLGLPGIPYEAALNATDKVRMRRVLTDAGVPSPRFCEVSHSGGLDAVDVPPLPVVVKPVDNMGARGVRRVEEEAALRDAVMDAIVFSRSGRAIIEEFIDGPEFSIDALIVDGRMRVCGIADRDIRFPPQFIEVGHTMPTAYGEREQSEVSAALSAAARALGIQNGAAKGDIFLTDQGAIVGEVAARLSGGYMSGWTYPYASGVPLTEAGMRIALGLDPGDLSPRRRWSSAERASISIPGRVMQVSGFDDARALSRIEKVFERCAPGDVVVFPRNNTEKTANVISAAPSRDEATTAAEEAIARIVVRLVPDDEATSGFLAEPGLPAAFDLSARINRAALDAMPDERPGAGCAVYRPLPEISAEHERDWNYRTIARSLSLLEILTGARPARGEEAAHGRSFWRALLKGGLQGALFYLDTINGGSR
ncbi:MAG: ATP-grasp domain-containing protein [Spirochaetes bacterium]|jgi:biotin carboxylase|nr:ATP-grasp domain-containing protein [Spirochaetota bacterium]